MFETELKFQVPASRWAAVRQAVATRTAEQTRLQAMYVETPGHDLAAAGLALRLRKEGRSWVQTLKGRADDPGQGLLQRLEHEVRLAPQRGLPEIDPARHDGTPAGQALQRVLAAARKAGRSDELRVLYRTDIQRLHRRVRTGGAVIEIALDQGVIEAEGKARVDVAEIEFELVSGPPLALTALAGRWAGRFDLWWDVRTKSERGFRLALDRPRVPATKAQAQALPPGEGLAPALAAMLQSALAQALPNLAEIAGAPAGVPAAPEHLHQLRVALRRLRTALSVFSVWAPDADLAAALEARWQAVFAQLGAARDADVLAAFWRPRLQAAGAPPLSLPPSGAGADVSATLRGADVSVLLLQTLAFGLSLHAPEVAGTEATEATSPQRKAVARALLQQAWRHAWADAKHFAQAPVAQQHRARKRLKRLRYALEFVAPLLPPKALKRWQRALAAALDALGEHNDLQTAKAFFAAQVEASPPAWFAVGWLAAQDEAVRQRAQAALARLKAKRRPWR